MKWLSFLQMVTHYSNINTTVATNTGGIFQPLQSEAATKIVFPPSLFLPSFSFFDTFLLIYFPSACLRPIEGPYLIPTSHLRHKVRPNSGQTHTHTHTKSARLSSIHQCLYPKKWLLTGHDGAAASPGHSYSHSHLRTRTFAHSHLHHHVSLFRTHTWNTLSSPLLF